MTTKELQNKIDELCDLQIQNLKRLTDMSVKESDVWAEDSMIQSKISMLRRELAKATLAEHRKKAKKFANETAASMLDTAMKFVR